MCIFNNELLRCINEYAAFRQYSKESRILTSMLENEQQILEEEKQLIFCILLVPKFVLVFPVAGDKHVTPKIKEVVT